MMELRKIGININQIAKKVNSTGKIDIGYFQYEMDKLNSIVDRMKNEYL